MSFDFLELARDNGYETASSAEEGTSKCVFQLNGEDDTTPPDVEDIGKFATELCGGVDNLKPAVVEYDVEGAGKIKRRLPKLHPYIPELSVAGCPKIVGTGDQSTGTSMQVLGLQPITDEFTHFAKYDFFTEFKRRPYFLLPDESVASSNLTYYKPDGSTNVQAYYAEEWTRYTTTTLNPLPDTISATTGGQMRFRSSAAVNGGQYPGQIWVYLQNQILEMNWFMVPYRYFFKFNGMKPYLTRFINTVNQVEFMGWDPGQLLFLGGTPTPFLPQSLDTVKFLGLGLFQSQALLCNVKMRWLATTRESDDVPAAGTAGLANLNNIAAGHNLQPSFTDRKFHYVTTEDPTNPTDETKWRASFPSFPHQLLFTDPMMAQPGGVI